MKNLLCGLCLCIFCGQPACALISGGGGELQPLPSVFCGVYPCLRYNVNGDCTACDCSGVSCGTNQKLTATCGCEQCAGCTNCTSDLKWTADDTGYVKRTARTCNCETCRASIEYSCADGFYGVPLGSDGCVNCVAATGNSYATSRAGNNSAITDCYIPSGTSITDNSGDFTYTQNCKYTN